MLLNFAINEQMVRKFRFCLKGEEEIAFITIVAAFTLSVILTFAVCIVCQRIKDMENVTNVTRLCAVRMLFV